MFNYLSKRLLWMVPMLIGISFICFLIMHLAPGDVTTVESAFNPKATEESRQKLREMYGLDKPIIVQYGLWLKRIVQLDFGESFASHHRPVFWEKSGENGEVKKGLIQEALPITLLINVLSLILILLIAIPLGILSAVYHQKLFDRIVTLFVFIGFAVPGFWLALLLIYSMGVSHDWLPISGVRTLGFEGAFWWQKMQDILAHLALPVLVSSVGGIAGIALFIRYSMLEALEMDYIKTARAKGLSEWHVIGKHAFRNALLPFITILGLSIPGLIGGSIIIESIFSIPGMGKLFYDAVLMRDFPVIMGILVLGAGLTLLGNFLADIAYIWADPRTRT